MGSLEDEDFRFISVLSPQEAQRLAGPLRLIEGRNYILRKELPTMTSKPKGKPKPRPRPRPVSRPGY